MNVLLVGSGGREHALAWKLAQSPLLKQLLIAPGNPGTAQVGRNVPLLPHDLDSIVDLARRMAVDLVVVGPDDPLAAGLVDLCQEAGIAAFGPTAGAARIESSKSFAKALMLEAGVPTPGSHVFDDAEEAANFVRTSGQTWVVKGDGLALGKGVIVPEDIAGTLEAITQLARLPAGTRLLLEERVRGTELSLLALCDGQMLLPLPPARDHKRLGTGDTGPNTGGMGAIAPAKIDAETYDEIIKRCMLPVIQVLAARGTPFRGALYAGIMLTANGPLVLEFNARFGDPEAQAILPLLDGDLLPVLQACATGSLAGHTLDWKPGAAACVVLAAAGYPDNPRRGDAIEGLESVYGSNVLVFHAGTSWENSKLVTSGGRVLGVTGLGRNVAAALDVAYETIDLIHFDGMQMREDIGRA